MLSLLVAAALVPATYNIPADKPLTYDLSITLEGFIPLMGGTEGKVVALLQVEAKGEAPTAEGMPQASSELKDAQLSFNDVPLNQFGLDAVKPYFPTTKVSMTPQGKVLSTDAPEVSTGVRIPGLDAQRFPDITYIPIEFPAEGIEEGKKWTFSKKFGGSDMKFDVTPTKITDSAVEMDLDVSQTAEYMEDSGKQVVTNEADAFSKVSVDFKGTGKATFNRSRGVIEKISINGTAKAKVVEIESKSESERRLDVKLESKLRQ